MPLGDSTSSAKAGKSIFPSCFDRLQQGLYPGRFVSFGRELSDNPRIEVGNFGLGDSVRGPIFNILPRIVPRFDLQLPYRMMEELALPIYIGTK